MTSGIICFDLLTLVTNIVVTAVGSLSFIRWLSWHCFLVKNYEKICNLHVQQSQATLD